MPAVQVSVTLIEGFEKSWVIPNKKCRIPFLECGIFNSVMTVLKH